MIPSDGKKKNPGIPAKDTFAVVIPVYNHGAQVEAVIDKAVKLNLPVIVVDDGSTDSGADRLKNIDGIELLRHGKNLGKGAAILTGFDRAAEWAGWAITIDADGQHNPEDALCMIRAIPENSRPLVVGMRQGMTGRNVPWTSRFGRKFSNFWIVLAGGPRMADSQCGFRIYPLPESLKLNVGARRFQFEVEILVKAEWKKLPVIEVPVSVGYAPGKERISHFRPFVDFLRNACTFTRLIAQRILIQPFIQKS